MERQGFREVDLLAPWHAIFGELESGRPITLPSEPGELRSAVARIGARSARSAPPLPRALRHVTAVPTSYVNPFMPGPNDKHATPRNANMRESKWNKVKKPALLK